MGELVQNGGGQGGDVAGPLPEGRNVDGKGVEAVIEVLSKLALIHIVRQAGVARGDHPHIHVDLLDAAHRTDAALLKHPEQLGLEAQVHLGDLVQEEGAAGGGLEEPQLAALFCPGEGPST